MASIASWADYKRENGTSSFEFSVADVDLAFAAVRDVAGLVVACGGNLTTRLVTYQDTNLSYAAIGFPPRRRDKPLEVQLQSGTAGEVGARYSYSFAYERGDELEAINANVLTEIVRIVDESGRKEVVLRNLTDLQQLPVSCLPRGAFKPETVTTFEFTPKDRSWSVTFSHDGYDPVDAVDFEGCCGFSTRMSLTFCVCPFLLPCSPCLVWQERNELHRFVSVQLLSMRHYMNSYGTDTDFQAEQHQRAPRVVRPPQARVVEDKSVEKGGVELAVEVVESEEDAAEKLEKWHKLYKSGAITYEEYEAFKTKLLQESDI